ncbi:hypothetical protein C8F01DRAFT_1184426, partial [Mycena amicta]
MSSAFLAPVVAASTLVAGVDVPYDVLNLLLSACPDFATLYAAVGVCYVAYGVPLLAQVDSGVCCGEIRGPSAEAAVEGDESV